MALATPVLATSVGSIPSVIDSEDDGLLVPPGDPAALTAALQRLMADGEWRRQLGRNGRDTVVAHFNAANTASAYEKLYLEALA
jgi:glycosyltransferase involved in cell wall biosynthesis